MTTTNSTKVNNEDNNPAYDVNGRKKKGFKTRCQELAEKSNSIQSPTTTSSSSSSGSSNSSDNSTQEDLLKQAVEVVSSSGSSPPQERRGSRVRRGSLLTARGESELLKDNSDRLSILMRDSNRGDADYLSTSDESDFDE